jgi:low affinity Fe/Cu permease
MMMMVMVMMMIMMVMMMIMMVMNDDGDGGSPSPWELEDYQTLHSGGHGPCLSHTGQRQLMGVLSTTIVVLRMGCSH